MKSERRDSSRARVLPSIRPAIRQHLMLNAWKPACNVSKNMIIENTADALKYLYGLSPNQSDLRFRGQAVFDWEIIPSIHRPGGLERYQTVQHEKFLLEKRPKKPIPPLTHTEFELEWLMVAQHYDVPTRLLDWTSDILIALYFACDGERFLNDDGVLVICKKDDYSQYNAYDESAMESQDLSFVSTNVVNPRMRLQSGCFMIWGHAPLDEANRGSYDLQRYHERGKKNYFLEKLLVPKTKKNEILKQLDKFYSISRDTLYQKEGYLERKYRDSFEKLKRESRLKTLYVTDADSLDPGEESAARALFRFECRNMIGNCTNIRRC